MAMIVVKVVMVMTEVMLLSGVMVMVVTVVVQASMRAAGVVGEWMVVVVEAPEARSRNKFPLRTTVLERLRQDLGSKSADRSVVVEVVEVVVVVEVDNKKDDKYGEGD